LSVLQNRQFNKLGSNEFIHVDIRLVCATNVPIAELANESRFRKDLIYRINTVEVMMPPLRRRNGDIGILANHFLKIYAEKYLKTQPVLDAKAIEKLNHYHFPGNIRELQYVVERAVIMADSWELSAN